MPRIAAPRRMAHNSVRAQLNLLNNDIPYTANFFFFNSSLRYLAVRQTPHNPRGRPSPPGAGRRNKRLGERRIGRGSALLAVSGEKRDARLAPLGLISEVLGVSEYEIVKI